MAEHFPETCLCFPADEQPWFRWRAEAEEAAKVLCPVHGQRFHSVQRYHLYQALHFYVTDFEHGWQDWSPQYQRAMRASLDPTRWPAEEIMLPWPRLDQNRSLCNCRLEDHSLTGFAVHDHGER